MPRISDPDNLHGRTYKLMGIFCRMLEVEYGNADPEDAKVTIPQFINALKMLYAYDVAVLMKDSGELNSAGSAVRKYASAFANKKADGARGRKKGTGPTLVDLGLPDDTDSDTDAA